jgi:hypothetical protein
MARPWSLPKKEFRGRHTEEASKEHIYLSKTRFY